MAFFLDNRDTIPHLLDVDMDGSSIMVLGSLKKPTPKPKQRSRSLTQRSPVMKEEITRSSSLSHLMKEMYTKKERNKMFALYATKRMNIFGQDE